MKIRYSRRATEDLKTISAYLKPRSASGAKNVRGAILATLAQLTSFPRLGRQQATTGVFKIVVRKYPYLIYYTVDDVGGTIFIVTIRHTSRQREFDDV